MVASTVSGAVFGIGGLVVLLAGLAALTSDCHDKLAEPALQPAGNGSPDSTIIRNAL